MENSAENSHLRDLNPPQLKAVEHLLGPILVFAGAGSGKTRVLTRRIAHLVLSHGAAPDGILAVTFTNKAALEMKTRLKAILGEDSSRLWVGTFHSTGLRILRKHAKRLGYKNDFAVYDEEDSRGILKKVVKEMGLDEKHFSIPTLAKSIDNAKNNNLFPEALKQASKGYFELVKAEVYEKYQQQLMAANAMDFGDLLLNSVKILESCPDVLGYFQRELEYLLVDEFQDTNKVQYRFIRLLAAPRNNLFVVGDDDQSIYAFRGADINNILAFEKDFPRCQTVRLEQNYRSSANILAAAHAVIVKNTRRKEKKLWTDQPGGNLIRTFLAEDETNEAEYIAREIRELKASGQASYKDIAIFYRTNAQSRAIEDSLMRWKIPYRIYGGLRFYERKEIKDILAYLRLISNPSDAQAFVRIINTPTRGIGAQTLQQILELAKQEALSVDEAARKIAGRSKNVRSFIELIDGLRADASSFRLSNLIAAAITRTGYTERLKELRDQNAESRIENLQELESLGRSLEDRSLAPAEELRSFLDRVALTAGNELPIEEQHDKESGAQGTPEVISMMTLHLAKGLEFPHVFFTGFEDGLIPHSRSLDDPTMLEEERRLCYVGITRAMHQLYLTRASSRGMFASGDFAAGYRKSSRFAADLPAEAMDSNFSDFLESGPKYLLDEELDDYEFDRPLFRKSGRLDQPEARRAKPALVSADSLANSGPLADPDQIMPGTAVIHPAFGRGVVQSIDGDVSGDLKDLKVAIKFETFESSKRLVFKYAKLTLA